MCFTVHLITNSRRTSLNTVPKCRTPVLCCLFSLSLSSPGCHLCVEVVCIQENTSSGLKWFIHSLIHSFMITGKVIPTSLPLLVAAYHVYSFQALFHNVMLITLMWKFFAYVLLCSYLHEPFLLISNKVSRHTRALAYIYKQTNRNSMHESTQVWEETTLSVDAEYFLLPKELVRMMTQNTLPFGCTGNYGF